MRRLHSWVILVYSVAALLLTWPLARHFTTHMPGNAIDDPALGWNLWWIKHHLIEQRNFDIFHVGWMFHPVEINLAFYTLTPLNGLLSIPLQAVFGLIVANNLVLLSSFVLSGYGAFLFVLEALRRETKRLGIRDFTPVSRPQSPVSGLYLAAFGAGLVYAFASAKLFYAALGQFNIASSQWIPFCALYVLRIGHRADLRGKLRNGALAALFLLLQAWAELTYASFLLIFIALYFLWLLLAHLRPLSRLAVNGSRSTVQVFRFALPFLLMAGLFLIGLSPFLGAMLPDMRAEGDFFTSGGGFSDTFSADLAGYLVPTRLHPLLGDWVARLPFPNDVGQQVYLGYSVLGLALIGAWRGLRTPHAGLRTHPWFWLGCTIFFWLMTLGPRVRWLGQETAIPGPFALISLLPFFNGNRYPSRYSVMLLLCVSVLVGLGLVGIWAWVRKRWGEEAARGWREGHRLPPYLLIPVTLIALFTAEHLSVPLPINDFRVPAIYQTLAAQPGDFAVLELPTGWRNGARVLGRSHELIMMQQWYQTVHGKRRLGGNTSRNPAYKFQYFTEAPLLGDLIALMVNEGEPRYRAPVIDAELERMIARNQSRAAEILADLGVRFVTVDVDRSSPALLRFVDEALPLTLVEEWQGSDWTGSPNTIRLYAVQSAPSAPPREINLATAAGNLYLGKGWSTVVDRAEHLRYATRPVADLLLNLPEEGGTLALELFGPASEVELWLNGQFLAATSLTAASDGQWTTLAIPPGMADQLMDRLEVRFQSPVTPVTELSAADGQPIIVVQSAGKDVGDFAQIWLNGVDVAVGTLGYNLAAITPDGQLLDSVAFNTHGEPGASLALATWIAQWPRGTIIAGAVMDEASYALQAEAVAALAQIGVMGDLRDKFRWSQAFIATVGEGAEETQERSDLLQPTTVYRGAPVAGTAVSGGVGRVRWEALHPPN